MDGRAPCVVHKCRHRGAAVEEAWYACGAVRGSREEAEADLALLEHSETIRTALRAADALHAHVSNEAEGHPESFKDSSDALAYALDELPRSILDWEPAP